MSYISDYDFYIALVHHPIKDKNGSIITTAVTNFDVHDIARVSASVGFKSYFIITPIKEQQALVSRITKHWIEGVGGLKNTARKVALQTIRLANSLEEAKAKICEEDKKKVKLVSTSAKRIENCISINNFTKSLDKKCAYLLVFGTGWGLDDSVLNGSDYILEPINYDGEYNHLSVRSAVSILADRIYNSLSDGK